VTAAGPAGDSRQAPGDGWYVYMVRCADGSLYTGIARDLERRVREHNGSLLGARYTRGRRPVELAYWEAAPDRAAASRRERQLKTLAKDAKEALIRAATATPTA